tara:strand:+ start:626 stop:940 length:315 start_codon:yes stop_codon:yes gene_type:complete
MNIDLENSPLLKSGIQNYYLKNYKLTKEFFDKRISESLEDHLAYFIRVDRSDNNDGINWMRLPVYVCEDASSHKEVAEWMLKKLRPKGMKCMKRIASKRELYKY